ncbi:MULTISPECIES: GGDEF domain-containing protein [Nitrospirillum]|uniref:diguanylate cyclase n=1 Tax=Nitrospirillum amazonense TaxID=28077 RepID=A0A560FUN9_9PROT|nr:diguanylate cyclase [Nitrospirillum amazonense]MEC4592587.1 diguanylate cyclase [Nitrospirillum amazonense]TWB25355.1 diguanylate cyclase (GGDEF)-like protein [Nitrospirillum amazonense]
MTRADDSLPTRRLTVAYVAALSLIALLSGSVHLLLDHVIAQQRDSGTIINVAGRQRMLSQRIGLLARDFYEGHDEAARVPLLQAAATMERAHRALLGGTGDMGITHSLSDAARTLYFSPPAELDRRTRDLVLAARILAGAEGPGAEGTADIRARAFADIRDQTRDVVMPMLDQAVRQFETEATERIEGLRRAQQGVLAILLTTLLAEAVFIFRPLVGRLKAYAGRLYDMATRDVLTGLPNRRHFLDVGEREVRRGREAGQPQALLMIDIDHFKAINDTLGHAAGDRVLTQFGRLLQGWLREGEVAGRIGGEEFAVLLPDADTVDAAARAETLRRAVEAAPVNGHATLAWTVSIGAARVSGGDDGLADALRRADLALYAAKAAGRNRVHLSADS